MIKRILLCTLCMSSWSFASIAQSNERVYYYKDRWGSKEVSSSKAKYAKHIRSNSDGSISTEWMFLPNNAVIQSQSYRGNVPIGLWIQANNNGKVTQELDYRFELRYSNDSCISGYRYKLGSDTLQKHIAGLFTPPQLIGYKDVSSYLVKTLRYPERAMEEGIEGRVILSISLSKEGSFSDIVVLKSADTSLDVEAFRVVRSMKAWKPATIDGKPIDLCITFPITFKLD